MLEKLKDLPPGIAGLKATGKVTKEDYERVFEPLVDEARREGRRLRFLYDLGPGFEGFTPSAVQESLRTALERLAAAAMRFSSASRSLGTYQRMVTAERVDFGTSGHRGSGGMSCRLG